MSDPTIRILLVEDHTAFRQTLELAFSREADLRVVGQAGSLAEARARIAPGSIDVAVLDLDLPDGNGASLIRDLHAANPRTEALVLTASVGPIDLARAIDAGASGVLHKTAPLSEIVAAIRRLYAGHLLIDRAELGALLQLARQQRAEDRAAGESLRHLTPREREVLAALAEGLSDKEIAQRMHVSKETVHTHMVNLLRKLGVESRLQALIFAVKHGVVRLG